MIRRNPSLRRPNSTGYTSTPIIEDTGPLLSPTRRDRILSSPATSAPPSPSKKNSLYLKIVFPPTTTVDPNDPEGKVVITTQFPFEFKVVCLDNNVNVTQAVVCIQKMYKLPLIGTVGLYDPQNRRWLEDSIALKDIPDLSSVESLEYRNQAEPINLGSTRERRKTRLTSPFFAEWQDSLKASMKQKEDAKKRQSQLATLAPQAEIEDLRQRLNSLSFPSRTATPDLLKSPEKPTLTRSLSAKSLMKDDKKEELEALTRALEEREAQAMMAAEIGRVLLEQNEELKAEIHAVRQREGDYNELRQMYDKAENKMTKLKSRTMFLNSQLEEALTVNVNLMSQIESNNQSTIGRSQKMRTPLQMARDEELEDLKYNLLQSQQQEEKMKKKIEKITVEKQMLEAQVHTLNEDLCDTQLGLTEQDDLKQHLRRTARENQKLMDAVSRYGKGTPGKSNQIDLQRMWGQLSAAVRQNEKSEKFGEMERKILENSKKTIEGMYEEVQSGKDMEQCVAGKILSVLKNGKSLENSGEEEGEAVSVSTLYLSLAVLSMTITGETENKLKDIISVDSEHERDMEELRLRMKTEETVRRKFEEKYVELKHKAEVEISNADRARQEALDSLVLVREEIAQQALFYEKEIETVKSALQEKSMKSHEDALAALRAEMEIAVREAQESGKSQVEESKLQVEREQRERLDQLQTELLRVCEERDRSVKKIESLQRDVDNVRKSMESLGNFVEEKRGESAKRVVDRLNDDERRLHELNEKSASLAIALQRIQNDLEQRKREEGEKEEEKKRREEEAEETKRQTEEKWSQEQRLRLEDSERSAEQIRKMEEKKGELEREREAMNRELEQVREEREKSVAREREEVKMKEESQEREKELSRKFQEMVEENRRSEEQKQNERAGTGQEMEKLREELEAEKRKFEENSKQQEDKLTEMHRQMEDMRKTIENLNQQKVVDQEAIRKFEENEKESEEEKKKMKKEMEEENERRKREEEERKKEEDLQRERRLSIPGHALLFAPGKLDENSMKTQEVDEAQRRVVDVFNELLSSHNAFRGRQPLGYTYYDVATSLFDGTLLCSLINVAAPGTIDGRVVVWTPEDWSSVMDNHNLCVNSAIGIGVQHSKNISSKMLADAAVPHILQFVAEVEEIYFLSKVSYSVHPVELYQLMKNIGQKPSTVRDMLPEDILMRWVNFHLRRSDPSAKEVNSFSNDFKDGSVLIRVLSQISPEHCGDSLNTITTPSDDPQELFKRAEKILSITSLMGCSKPILGARDIVQGTGHLITVLLADVYHHFPTVPPVTPTSTSAPSTPRQPFVPSSSSLDLTANMKEEEDGNREERAFRLWMNSVGFTIRNMSEDLRDGLVLLKVMDSIVPNKVNWNKVNVKVPLNAYQKIENCNYVVSMAQSFKFSVTNIGGKDLYEGNRKLTLGIVWQIIRLHMFTILNDLRTSMSASSKEFSENDIIQWANGQMTDHDKPLRITGFKDTTLRNGKFLLDLIDCIRPGRVNYGLVMQGEESEDFKLNAQYAISLARGLGCCVFLLWEDITELNPKMLLTFVGTLMSMWAKSSLPPDRAH